MRCAPTGGMPGSVHKPAVGQNIEGLVGRFHIDRASVSVQCCQISSRAPRAAVDPRKRVIRLRASRVSSRAEPENDLILLAGFKIKAYLNRSAGVQRSPQPAGRRVRLMAAGARSEPLRPKNSVRLPVMVRAVSSTSKSATRPLNSVLYGLRAERAALRVSFGDHVHGGLRAQFAQHPLNVSGGGKAAGARRDVARVAAR